MGTVNGGKGKKKTSRNEKNCTGKSRRSVPKRDQKKIRRGQEVTNESFLPRWQGNINKSPAIKAGKA